MTSNFIKLKSVSNLPSSRIIKSTINGIDYKGKKESCLDLKKRINSHNEFSKIIKNIDSFNYKYNLMPSHKQVILQKRTENYNKNIINYIKPLKIINLWNKKSMFILNNIWIKFYDKQLLSNLIFNKGDDRWIDQTDIEDFKSKYNFDFIINDLQEWKKNNPYLNFFPLMNALKIMKEYNITDFSATSKLLTIYRNQIVDIIN